MKLHARRKLGKQKKNVELSQVKLKPFISWRKEKEDNWLEGYWVEKSVDLFTLQFRLNSFHEKWH